MQIIDAFWEKENLGVTSKEVVVDLNDSVDTVRTELAALNDQYIVVKIPASQFDVTNLVQNMGYRFVEEMIEVEHDLHEVKRNSVVTRKFQTLSYLGVDAAELQNFVVQNGISGIDRIVPVGKTADFAFVWDGYDLIEGMSRCVKTLF